MKTTLLAVVLILSGFVLTDTKDVPVDEQTSVERLKDVKPLEVIVQHEDNGLLDSNNPIWIIATILLGTMLNIGATYLINSSERRANNNNKLIDYRFEITRQLTVILKDLNEGSFVDGKLTFSFARTDESFQAFVRSFHNLFNTNEGFFTPKVAIKLGVLDNLLFSIEVIANNKRLEYLQVVYEYSNDFVNAIDETEKAVGEYFNKHINDNFLHKDYIDESLKESTKYRLYNDASIYLSSIQK